MYLDSAIFILFLLINLLVSIRAITHSSIQTTHYTTTAHIISIILSITYGGEILCNSLHIDELFHLTGSAVSYLLSGNLLAHRFHVFLHNRSVAEMMGQLYGNSIRKIVAICGILHSTSVIAMQFKLLTTAICCFFSIPSHYSLIIAAFLIVCNARSNTMSSLALIHVIRCAIFSLLLPIIAWALWKNMVNQYNVNHIQLALAIKQSWNSMTDGYTSTLDYILYFTIFSIPSFHPAQVTQIVSAKNVSQIKRAFNGAGYFALGINLLLLWITLLIKKNSNQLMLSAIPLDYPGLNGLLMISVTALTTATISANLDATTILMANDLSNLFKFQWVKTPTIYQGIIGVIATLIVLYTKDSIIWVTTFLFKTTVTLPLLLSLIGISLHPYAVLIGILAGGITTISWFCFMPNIGISSLLPAIMMNLFSIMIVHFFKGKRASNQHCVTDKLAQETILKPPPLWEQLSKYIIKIKKCNLAAYLQLPKNNLPYILFSFYILLTNYGSFYTFSSNPIWHSRLETFILFPSLFIATFFLMYTSLSPSQIYIRKIASIIWPLSQIYFLFLVGTGMVILSKFTYLHSIIFILNLCISIFITPLIMILFGSITSVIMAWIILHHTDSNTILIDYFLDLRINIAYIILMLLFILVSIFLYYKNDLNKRLTIIQALTSEQEERNARQFFNKQQVEALAYESTYIISQLNHQLLRLEQSKEGFLAYSEQLIRLKKYFKSIFQHLKHNIHLVTNWISIDQLLAECFDAIKINNIYDTPYVMINTKHLYIQCAIESIKNLIINSLYSCSAHESLHSNQRKDIYIYIDDTQLGYRLTLLQGKLQKINAISVVITTATNLPTIRPIYKVAEMANIQIVDNNSKRIYSDNQHIVHSHYGYYEWSCSKSEITHLYVIPVNVKEIAKAFATLSPVVYTQKMVLDLESRQTEAIFLEKVKQKKGINIDAVIDALQLIKVYYTIQRRKTGELFYLHPIAVASILLTITDDSSLIIAGLVHDIVQNTPLTEAGLTTLFSPSITQTVLAAARLEKELPNQKDDYDSYIKQITHNNNHDAILVRLADVLHNARTISGHSIEKQIEKAKLMQKFYLPLALQIQLIDIANELQLHVARILNI